MATAEQTAQLSEARAARHKLMTGTSVVRVTRNGMAVEYTRASLYELNAYIQQLEQIVEGQGTRRPPTGFRF